MKFSMNVIRKDKNRAISWSSYTTPEYVPQVFLNELRRDTCTVIYFAAFVTTVKF